MDHRIEHKSCESWTRGFRDGRTGGAAGRPELGTRRSGASGTALDTAAGPVSPARDGWDPTSAMAGVAGPTEPIPAGPPTEATGRIRRARTSRRVGALS